MSIELTEDEAHIKALEAVKNGEYIEAAGYYLAIIKNNEACADAHHNMGSISAAAGLIREAKDYFAKAIELEPKNKQYYKSFIKVLLNESLLEEAEVVSEAALQIGVLQSELEEIVLSHGFKKSGETK